MNGSKWLRKGESQLGGRKRGCRPDSRPRVHRQLFDLVEAPRDGRDAFQHIGDGESAEELTEVELAADVDDFGNALGGDRRNGPDIAAIRKYERELGRGGRKRDKLIHLVDRSDAAVRQLACPAADWAVKKAMVSSSLVDEACAHAQHLLASPSPDAADESRSARNRKIG